MMGYRGCQESMLKSKFKTECFGLSDIGLVRQQNEDAYALLPEQNAFIIADGMGGRNGGEIASNMAVNELKRFFLSEKIVTEECLSLNFVEVNNALYKKALEKRELSGMGTTLTCMVLLEQNAIYSHVGDSRLYLLREGVLSQITKDHSLVNDWVDLGVLDERQEANFPYKHILTKAVGTNPTIEPAHGSLELMAGDQLLLTTDGLTNFVSDETIEAILLKKADIKAAVIGLIEEAKKCGGGDNITAILVRINDLFR